MNLEHAEHTLNDLHAWLHKVAFERDIGHAIDFDTGRDLDIQARHALRGQEALGDGRHERGELRLHVVDEDVCSEVNFCHVKFSLGNWMATKRHENARKRNNGEVEASLNFSTNCSL